MLTVKAWMPGQPQIPALVFETAEVRYLEGGTSTTPKHGQYRECARIETVNQTGLYERAIFLVRLASNEPYSDDPPMPSDRFDRIKVENSAGRVVEDWIGWAEPH